MNESTSVLLGLEDEFTVLQLERIDADTVRVVIEVIDPEGACPECGVLTSRIKERPLVRVKDLPASGQRTDLWWLKRRLVCRDRPVGQRHSRNSPALCRHGRGSRPGYERRSVRRSRRATAPSAGWTRSNPWMTSFVDADPTLPGRLLGLTPGCSGACVIDWLALQTPAFRAGIDLVVIDPSAPYAGGIRTALADARIAVDKWHLVALANLMVTQVRQRITR